MILFLIGDLEIGYAKSININRRGRGGQRSRNDDIVLYLVKYPIDISNLLSII